MRDILGARDFRVPLLISSALALVSTHQGRQVGRSDTPVTVNTDTYEAGSSLAARARGAGLRRNWHECGQLPHSKGRVKLLLEGKDGAYVYWSITSGL
jgi:hypothetical protein